MIEVEPAALEAGLDADETVGTDLDQLLRSPGRVAP